MLLSPIVFFVLPTAVLSENYYLILTKRGTGLERIEMDNKEDCDQLGKQWSEVSGSHTYACLQIE
ncbi:hypothetical protein EV07_0839 [Prochlorococcus sp. MIT 0603]|nr:hypothetical protein EV07_0839 [Prochlorococcus sp. MIT 0603]